MVFPLQCVRDPSLTLAQWLQMKCGAREVTHRTAVIRTRFSTWGVWICFTRNSPRFIDKFLEREKFWCRVMGLSYILVKCKFRFRRGLQKALQQFFIGVDSLTNFDWKMSLWDVNRTYYGVDTLDDWSHCITLHGNCNGNPGSAPVALTNFTFDKNFDMCVRCLWSQVTLHILIHQNWFDMCNIELWSKKYERK